MSRSTDYKAELNRLLSKATGTPYESITEAIEGKNSSSNGNISEMSLFVDSEIATAKGQGSTPHQGRVRGRHPFSSKEFSAIQSDRARSVCTRQDAPQAIKFVVARASPHGKWPNLPESHGLPTR